MVAIDVARALVVGRYPILPCSTYCLYLRIKFKPVQEGMIYFVAYCINTTAYRRYFPLKISLHLFQQLMLNSLGASASRVLLYTWILYTSTLTLLPLGKGLINPLLISTPFIRSSESFFQATSMVINRDCLLIGLSFNWKCNAWFSFC